MRMEALRNLAAPKGLIGGPFGSSLVGSDYVDEGVPVIRGNNLGKNRTVVGPFAFVTPEKVSRDLVRNTAEPGDIVFTQRGTLGQVAIVPNNGYERYVISQSQMRLRVNEAIVSAAYVYYACTAPGFLRQIGDNSIATGVPHINLGILGRLQIPIHKRRYQEAIVDVLGVLDDKISANARLARIADRLAGGMFSQAVADTSVSDSTFEQVCEVGGGGTPKTGESEFWDGGILWATPTDVTALSGPYLEFTARTITCEGLAACSSPLYPAGSILMTSRATIGAFAIATVPMAVNQGFIVVNPHDARLRYWFFHEMRDRVDELISHANGATFLELSRGSFKRLPVRLASESVMTNFCERAAALHASAAAALLESRLVRATRDELLPLLISGRLRVKDAEAVAESVL